MNQIRLLLATGLYAGLVGCICAADPGGTGGGAGGGSGGGSPKPITHFQCSNVKFASGGDAGLDNLIAALAPPYADGTTEIPITPDGCFRMYRTAEGGALKRVQIARYTGFEEVIRDGGARRERDVIAIDWIWSTLGTENWTLKVDVDLDDHFERQIEEQSDSTGLTLQRSTTYSKATQAITRRSTLTAAAGMMHLKQERLIAGALQTVSDRDEPQWQRQLGCALTGPGQGQPDDPATCDPGLKAKIRDALRQGVNCMMNNWQLDDVVMRLSLLSQQLDKVDITCFRNTSYLGEANTRRPGGRLPLRINADLTTCSDTFLKSTLFHEMMHFEVGPHTGLVESALQNGPEMDEYSTTYLDPLRACEQFCFGKIKTRCSCASCLRTNACDGRCSNYDSCVRYVPNDAGINLPVMSQAVGAICEDPPGVGHLYRNLAACKTACANPSNCSSKSLSCDDTCQ